MFQTYDHVDCNEGLKPSFFLRGSSSNEDVFFQTAYGNDMIWQYI